MIHLFLHSQTKLMQSLYTNWEVILDVPPPPMRKSCQSRSPAWPVLQTSSTPLTAPPFSMQNIINFAILICHFYGLCSLSLLPLELHSHRFCPKSL
ncbi:hypothetical protein ECG_04491 [Echinococcus granulosus]|uniref:Ovule protein n=1 Tax=Echinococcus granulosus TaxID=6210 RepID=A0A068WC05_ECHGR|nr:hypothetical protein ECG_04491 [Echinococcus granulosus]CDS17226.1 hypothetical protein EgrG_000996300 [Echinococcus granulosus]